jgi:hypothetical protein
MLKTLAAALAFGLTVSPLAAYAQSDTPAGTMSDKSMSASAPKKPMMKHHPTHKKSMAKSMSHSETMKGGDMQQKM